jgi:hypothetical protein
VVQTETELEWGGCSEPENTGRLRLHDHTVRPIAKRREGRGTPLLQSLRKISHRLFGQALHDTGKIRVSVDLEVFPFWRSQFAPDNKLPQLECRVNHKIRLLTTRL